MKETVCERLKKELAKKHACYVLITCNKPSDDGDMQVEFSFEGDAALASYLIQGAQSYLEEKLEEHPLYG